MADLAPAVLVATAVLVLVLGWFRRGSDERVLLTTSVAGALLSGTAVILAWASAGGAPRAGLPVAVVPGAADVLSADPLTWFAQALVGLALIVTLLTGTAYVRRRGLCAAEYHVLLLLAASAMMVLCAAADLVVVFLAVETFSIALYVLSAYLRGDRLGQESALKFFVLGSISAAFLLYGTALVYAALGSTELSVIGAAVSAQSDRLPAMVVAGLGLLVVGLGFKLAVVPFHQWTPDVYQGAPTTVTAFMAAGTKVAALVAFARILWTAFAGAWPLWMPLLAGLAVATMTLGNLAALVQRDLKRMLGYSAIAHTGYLLVAVMAGTHGGLSAALYYLLGYALMNLGAFAVLSLLVPADGRGDASSLDDVSGLAARHGGLALALAVFLVSLAGIPPTVGFLAKWYVFRAAIGAGWPWLAVVIVLNSVVAAFYYLRPVAAMYIGEAPEGVDLAPDVPAPAAATVGLLALAVALAIVLSPPILSLAARVRPATTGAVTPSAEAAGPYVSTLAALEP